MEGLPATRRNQRFASAVGLQHSLASEDYPEFLAMEGPANNLDPCVNSELDFVRLLWPTALCSLIADETNRYAFQKKRKQWVNTSTSEIWTFLGIVILMGIHRLPRIRDYWSTNTLLGVPRIQQQMSLKRFWEVWSNLHVVNNETASKYDLSYKIKPVLDTLSRTFFEQYNPSQELSVDEAMVKYKGRATGKVRMPNKPIKLGFKIWSCCCSCCGYLCSFQVYQGKPVDPITGKSHSEVGLVKRVMSDLLSNFKGMNYVVYCDSFFTNTPIVDMLAADKIYTVGTIRRGAKGFPDELKTQTPLKGEYICKTVGHNRFFVFNDQKVVCFVTNAFPEVLRRMVPRVQSNGLIALQSVPPLLPAYNKFMGGVDRHDQIRKTYGFDRKSKRYWFRLFFYFFDTAINNAYLLYKHNCATHKKNPKELLQFRLELVDSLFQGSRKRSRPSNVDRMDQSHVICTLMRVTDLGLKRGRCYHCQQKKVSPVHFTSFGCSACRIRLCKTGCFTEYHSEHQDI